MSLLPLFYQIIVLFFILITGFVVYRVKLVDDHGIASLSRLIIEVTQPAMIIISMNYDFSREILWETGLLFVLSLAFYLGSWGLGVFLTKMLKMEAKAASVYQFMLTFPNVGFMGYPVIAAIFGKLGVFYTSIFNLTFSLVVWTLGVWLFRRDEGGELNFNWKILFTPGIVSTVIGFAIFLFSIKLPYPIYQTLDLLGGVTTPMSMLLVGALMGRSKLGAIWKDVYVYLASAIRLLAIPFLIMGGLWALGYSSTLLGTIVVLMGMPGAANTAIFAARYEGDADLGSRTVFISTLFSVATIPLLVFVLRMMTSW